MRQCPYGCKKLITKYWRQRRYTSHRQTLKAAGLALTYHRSSKVVVTQKKIAKRFFWASTVRPFGADHRSPSKVCLRQKKSRSDFFWRRPCGRSAQSSSSSCGRAGRHSKRRAGWHSKRRAGWHIKCRTLCPWGTKLLQAISVGGGS